MSRTCALALALCIGLSGGEALADQPNARLQAIELHKAGNTAEAVTLLEQHLTVTPGDWPATQIYAELLVATVEPAQAVRTLSGLAMRHADQPTLLLLLSKSHEAAGDRESAAVAMQAAARAIEQRRELVDPNIYLDLARLHSLTGNRREEAAALDRYLVTESTDQSAMNRLAFLRERMGHHEDAQRVLAKLHQAVPKNVDVLRRLAETHVHTEQPFTAITLYKQALDLEPGHVPTMRRLAELYGWNDQHMNRLKMLQSVSRALPASVPDHVTLAEALYEQEKYRLAVQSMRHAVRLKPTDNQLKLRLATMLEATDEYSEALGILQELNDDDPGNQEVQERLAVYHHEQGQNLVALDYYRLLQDADPDDPNINRVVEDLDILVRPRLGIGYEFRNDRNGHVGHGGRIWLENQPSDFWRYFVGYKFAYHTGRSLNQTGLNRELQSHGGWLGVRLRLARYTSLDAEISVNGYVDSFTFVGTRVGITQKAIFPLEVRIWFERREDSSTVDALASQTVVYDIHAQLEVEPVDRWLLEFGGSYGRWLHTDYLTGNRERNNGYSWYAGMGVRAIEEPVTLEFMVDYTGMAFDKSSDDVDSRIPYFSPDIYQTVGLRAFFEHQAHWRFLYRLYARPHWVFEDEALQINYGVSAEIKFHKRHWLELTYERSDTLVGTTENVFRENVVKAVYIGVF